MFDLQDFQNLVDLNSKAVNMNGLIFFFSTLGVFHGFALSLYLFFFAKHRTLSKYLLGALILVLSIRIGKSVLLYFNRDLAKVYLQIGLSGCLFIGPFLYFYLKTVLKQITELPKSWKWILWGLLAFIIIIGSIRPYQTYPDFWNTVTIHIIYATWLIGLIASGFVLIPIFRKGIASVSNISSIEKWLAAVYFGNVLIAIAFFIALWTANSWAYYITGPLVFSFFIYLLAFGYFNNEWFEMTNRAPIEKYQNKKIDQGEADKLLAELDRLMTDKAIYTNSQLKLKEVAEELNIPQHQLSQLLNDNLGKGYKTFINEYRIQAACQMLGTSHQLSLEGIGYEVGFRSKSTFFTTFKKIKGITPAQYKQEKSANPPK